MDPLVLQALMEGHAVWCSELFATRNKSTGLVRVTKRIMASYRQAADSSRAPDAKGGDLGFFYIDGYRFIKRMAAQNPSISIDDVFKRRLPTQRHIAFPDEYLEDSKPSSFNFFPMVEQFECTECSKGSARTRYAEFPFVDMRLMLYRLRLTEIGIKTACRCFKGGVRITYPTQEIVVLAFVPDRTGYLPVYIRRCTSDYLVGRDLRTTGGRRLKVPKAAATTTDAWIVRAPEKRREGPTKIDGEKPARSLMHAVFAGKCLYVRSAWKVAHQSDVEALKIVQRFVEHCRKADAECARFFKDESGDDEWD